MSLSELKSDEEKVDFLIQKQVDATFFKKGDDFVFSIKRFGIIAKGKTLEESYHKLEEKRAHYYKEMVEIGCEEDIPFSDESDEIKSGSQKGIKTNVSKYFIFRDLFMVALIFVFVGVGIRGIGKPINKLGQKLEKALLNPSQVKKEKYLRNLKSNLERISPYVKTIKNYWENI